MIEVGYELEMGVDAPSSTIRGAVKAIFPEIVDRNSSKVRDKFTVTADYSVETNRANPNVEILGSKRKGLEDRFNAGVPEPNRNFGKLVNQTTPTVPTTMEGTLVKPTPVIDSNWTVFQSIVDNESKYSTLGIANWFPDTHAFGFTLHAENFGTMYRVHLQCMD